MARGGVVLQRRPAAAVSLALPLITASLIVLASDFRVRPRRSNDEP